MARIDDFGVWAEAGRNDVPSSAAARLARVAGPLLGFYWVYRSGGYAKAARIFPYPLTQPGLHRQIALLESSLGQRLFERGAGRGIVPTRAGRALYLSLVPFLQSLEHGGDLAGEVRVHVSRVVIDSLLPAWIARVAERYPKLTVVVHELRAPDTTLLHAGVADVVIAHFSGPPSETLERHRLCTLAPYLVHLEKKSQHARAVSRPLLRALSEQAFVAYRPDLEGHALQRAALAKLGLNPRIVALVDSASSAQALVNAGVGFTIVPAIGRTALGNLSSVEMSAIADGRSFAIDAVVRAIPDPLVRAFLDQAPKPNTRTSRRT
jgi:DNA-binding transcriptional LysR family regulator